MISEKDLKSKDTHERRETQAKEETSVGRGKRLSKYKRSTLRRGGKKNAGQYWRKNET